MSDNTLEKDLQKRQKRVQDTMREMEMDGCLLGGNINIYYMAGRVFNGYYYLPAEGEPWCFVKRPNNISGNQIVPIRKPEQITDFFQSEGIAFPRRLFLETDDISYNECTRLQVIFQHPEIGNASTLMRQIRALKTHYEISQLRLC
ncbi:MAG: aminopeptidase P family N-terminal domain-containing protein, partial [Tannerella sp.]|nr:aminopeptidase P family N-terminal domain-containing protein [Tannerella sp.]